MVNAILSKVWRKLNTFLESEARNLESSGHKPLHCFWNSAFDWPLGHVLSQRPLPDISGVLMFPAFFFFFETHTDQECDQMLTCRWGRLRGTGKRPGMAPGHLQGLREDWSGQSGRDSKEKGNSLAQPSHAVSNGDPRQSSWSWGPLQRGPSQQKELFSVLNSQRVASQWVAGC